MSKRKLSFISIILSLIFNITTINKYKHSKAKYLLLLSILPFIYLILITAYLFLILVLAFIDPHEMVTCQDTYFDALFSVLPEIFLEFLPLFIIGMILFYIPFLLVRIINSTRFQKLTYLIQNKISGFYYKYLKS